ncbi:SPOR domain-containing protein [Paracoccus sp. JM45]|uniref:SPOR domain-containing protein n=1 Tax=Paracoccus sp. JM45 TaxID=2283626 RepID=UPI00160457BE|nr:SPOR domain-containing protein [Paracoccus sp. JM45]
MTRIFRLAMILMTGAAADAAPVSTPPDGFAGTQYIDNTGCVFAHSDAGWTARLDGAGQPLCGFPPSIGVNRADAAPLVEEPDAETLLIEQLTQHLRPGEWSADPRPAETRHAAPVPAADPIQTTLKDALFVAPALRQASGLQISQDVCAQLGYEPDTDTTPIPQAALGLCAGMKAGGLAPAAAAKSDVPAARLATKTASAIVARRPSPPRVSKPMLEIIPASARYIQVGAFEDGENALIVLRALSGQGYPVAQTRINEKARGMRVIMAGPFLDRKTLVEALVTLRQTGYAGAMPR